MKIYGITSSINFGYNKDLNDRVNKKLENAKGNKELAQTLLRMNKLCMETEDKLREAENKNNHRLIFLYSDMLVPMKAFTADQIDDRFPQMNYVTEEIKSYDKEIKSKHFNDNWRMDIVEYLKDNQSLKHEIKEAFKNKDSKSSNTSENIKEISKEQKPNTQQQKVENCKFVEEFIPNEYSPKGFDSLGGMDDIKETLKDKIIIPLNDPELAKLDEVEYGKKSPRGELLYGPPGCGKTSVMEALAAESGLPLYKLKVSKAGSIYVNGSAKNVQQGYEFVKNIAKTTGKPVFLAIDEMESMTANRNNDSSNGEDLKLVSTLLQIIEEARGNNVIILGATNYYDRLDDAIKSRFEDKIYVGLPDDETRKSVLKIHLNKRTKGQPLAANDEELNKVVQMTAGFSNRDISILVDKAAMNARADNRRNISAEDFIKPVQDCQNMKVKETNYKDKTTRPSVGFGI